MWSLDVRGSFRSRRAWGKECRWSFLWKQGSSLWWVTCLGFPQMLSTQQSLQALEYRGCVGMRPRNSDLPILISPVVRSQTRGIPSGAHFLICPLEWVCVWGGLGLFTSVILSWCDSSLTEEEQKVRLRKVMRKREPCLNSFLLYCAWAAEHGDELNTLPF